MNEAGWHRALTLGLLGLAVVTFVALLWVSAPYGRHQRDGWGPRIDSRVGWIVMESPACLVFLAVYLRGRHAAEWVPLLLLGLWQAHYVYRAFVYPWRLRGLTRRMPVVVAALGLLFQCLNSYLNARWISDLGQYEDRWLFDPRLGVGVAIFGLGASLHLRADAILRRLRSGGEGGYRVPFGGPFRWVSCPNYLGEMVEWVGWAIATWSLSGLAFAIYTAANLVPRARSHHQWYRRHFADYPPERRALLPGVW